MFWVLCFGVTGSGKTTIAQKLAEYYHVPFIDADDFHPIENVEKMRNGIALTDEDRIPWLLRISQHIELLGQQYICSNDKPSPFSKKKNILCTVACSALKQQYRELLLTHSKHQFIQVYLRGSQELIEYRINQRENHFAKSNLLPSQFAVLEIPSPDDSHLVSVDISLPVDDILSFIISEIDLRFTN